MRRVVEAAPGLGIGVLTLFAFSADNWRRPPAEVAALMRLFREYLRGGGGRAASETACGSRWSGRRDRLDAAASARDRGGGARDQRTAAELLLRIAIDYSARDAILRAAQCLRDGHGAEPRVVRPTARHRGPRHARCRRSTC